MLLRRFLGLVVTASLLVSSVHLEGYAQEPRRSSIQAYSLNEQALNAAALNFKKFMSPGWDRLWRARIWRPLRSVFFTVPLDQAAFSESVQSYFAYYAQKRDEFAQALQAVDLPLAQKRFHTVDRAYLGLIDLLGPVNLPEAALKPLQEEWREMHTAYELLRQPPNAMRPLALEEVAVRLVEHPVRQDPLAWALGHGMAWETLLRPRAVKANPFAFLSKWPVRKLNGKTIAVVLTIVGVMGLSVWTYWLSRSMPGAASGSRTSLSSTASSPAPVPPSINGPSPYAASPEAASSPVQEQLAQLEREGQANNAKMRDLNDRLATSRQTSRRLLQDLENEQVRMNVSATADPAPNFFAPGQQPSHQGQRMTIAAPVNAPTAGNVPAPAARIQHMTMADDRSHTFAFEFERPVQGFVTVETMTRYDVAQDGWVRLEPTLETTHDLAVPTGPILNHGAMTVMKSWTALPRVKGFSIDPNSIQFDQPNVSFDVRQDKEGTVFLMVPGLQQSLRVSFAYRGGEAPEVLTVLPHMLERMNPVSWQRDTQTALEQAQNLPDNTARAVLLRVFLADAMEYSLNDAWDAAHSQPPGQRIANVDRFRVPIATRGRPVEVGDCEEGNNMHVAHLREAGVPAVLDGGYYSDTPRRVWTAISGHAWARYYSSNEGWKISDATPPDTDGLESAQDPDLPIAQGGRTRMLRLERQSVQALREESRLTQELDSVRVQEEARERRKQALEEKFREEESRLRNTLLTQRNAVVQNAGKALDDFLSTLKAASPNARVDIQRLEGWVQALPAEWPADVRQRTNAALWKEMLDWASPDQRPALLERYDRAVQPLLREDGFFRPFVAQAQGLDGPFPRGTGQRWVGGWLPRQQGAFTKPDPQTTPLWTGVRPGASPGWVQDAQGRIIGFQQGRELYDLKGQSLAPIWNIGLIDNLVRSEKDLYALAGGRIYKLPSSMPLPVGDRVEKVEKLLFDDLNHGFYVAVLHDGTRSLFALNDKNPLFTVPFIDIQIAPLSNGNWAGLALSKEGNKYYLSIDHSDLGKAARADLLFPPISQAAFSMLHEAFDGDKAYHAVSDEQGLRIYSGRYVMASSASGRIINFRYEPTRGLQFDMPDSTGGKTSWFSWTLPVTPSGALGDARIEKLPGEPLARGRNGESIFVRHEEDGRVSLIVNLLFSKEPLVTPPMHIDLSTVRLLTGRVYFHAEDPDTKKYRVAYYDTNQKRVVFLSNPAALAITPVERWPGVGEVFAERHADGWHWQERDGQGLFSMQGVVPFVWKGEPAVAVIIGPRSVQDGYTANQLWIASKGQWVRATPSEIGGIRQLMTIKGALYFVADFASADDVVPSGFFRWNGEIDGQSRGQLVSPAGQDVGIAFPGSQNQDAWLGSSDDPRSLHSVMHPSVVQPLSVDYNNLYDEQALAVDPSSEMIYLRSGDNASAVQWKPLVAGSAGEPVGQGWPVMWFDGHGHRYGLRPEGSKGRWVLENERRQTLAVIVNPKYSGNYFPSVSPDGTLVLPITDEGKRASLYALRDEKLLSKNGPYDPDQVSYSQTPEGGLVVDEKAGEAYPLVGVRSSETTFEWRGSAGLQVMHPKPASTIPEAIGKWTPITGGPSLSVSPQQLVLLRSQEGQALLVKDPGSELRQVFQELLDQNVSLTTPSARDAWSNLRAEALTRYRKVMGPNPSVEDRLLAVLVALGSPEEKDWLDALQSVLNDPAQKEKARASILNLMRQRWERLSNDHAAPFAPMAVDLKGWERLWNQALKDMVSRPFPQRLFGASPNEFLAHDATLRLFIERYPLLAPTKADWGALTQPTPEQIAREMTRQLSFWLLMIPLIGTLLGSAAEATRAWSFRRRIALLSGWASDIHQGSFFPVSYQKALFLLYALPGVAEVPRSWKRHVAESLTAVPALFTLMHEWRLARHWETLHQQWRGQPLHADHLPVWILIDEIFHRVNRHSQPLGTAA